MYLADDSEHVPLLVAAHRTKVHVPGELRGAWTVICSEVLINRGASTTYAAERVAAEVEELDKGWWRLEFKNEERLA